jgi:hypothetical protein
VLKVTISSLLPLLVMIGCHTDAAVSPSAPLPEVIYARVVENPHNVLSVVVTAQVQNADSVAVHFETVGRPLTTRTPARPAQPDSVILPVLGLRAETTYNLRVVAYGNGKAAYGANITFTTGMLPADLPTYVAHEVDPTPGFVVFAAHPYAVAIDNAGAVVWYRRFSNGPGLNFQAQAGRYLLRPPTSDPREIGGWLELDALGNTIRTLACVGGLPSRFHDLLLEPDGSYWIMCDETRTMDLSGLGGAANARVTGTVIQHVSAAGALLFQWTPFEHFDIADLHAAERSGPLVNWTHGNALALDAEGHLLVSSRNLNEITKIDTRTGRVVWRMSGVRNQFTFQGTTTPAFARQHGLRATAANQLLILDNSGDDGESKAERYVYDERTSTAHKIASYSSMPPIVAQVGGTVQDLPGGHTLVSFGSAGRVEEYDASGSVVWRLEQPGYVFRAQRIQSLYEPGVGLRR